MFALFNMNGSVFMEHYVPLNQKLAAFKRKLVENGLDGEDDYLTIEGDC